MRLPTFLFALFLSVSLAAQSNRDDMTPLDLDYTLTVLESKKGVHIQLDIGRNTRSEIRVAMPNWAPGAYRITRYGDKVQNLKAIDAKTQKELAVEKLDHQTWAIPTGGIERISVSYDIPEMEGRFASGADRDQAPTGFHFQGPATFLYVVDGKHLPIDITYKVPEGWKVANGLHQKEDPMQRWTTDYDTFADCPTIVGRYEQRTFTVRDVPFHCIYFNPQQKYDFDMDAYAAMTKKIVEVQGDIFGGFPFPHYWFLFSIGAGGGGGLEHLNSTSIGLSSGALRNSVTSGASVTSHEFFHAWNVKRIHPKVLGPFEYEHENYTGNLWVSEGWTSYYGDLTLARCGVMTRDAYLGQIKNTIAFEWSKEGHQRHSVYWASRNVWHRTEGEPPRVDYYATGEILGLLIDLKIRHETKNQKSLDDVMRFLNRWFGVRRVGFEEDDIERACTAVSNFDFGPFFARHVRGTVTPPFAEYLKYAGINYEESKSDVDFPFALTDNDDGTKTVRMRRAAAARDDGLERGDVIVAVTGTTMADVKEFMKTKKAGDAVEIEYKRGEEKKKTTVKLVARPNANAKIEWIAEPTPLQAAIRESWITGR